MNRARASDDIGNDRRHRRPGVVALGLDDDAALDRAAAKDAVLDNVDVDGVLAVRSLDVVQMRAAA